MAKSQSEAEKYRKLGNEFFAQRNLDSALDAYGQSILQAPESSESWAYAFGNRSAVLFEMEAFSECLRDIDRALACQQCPDGLKEKLNRRKAKCESDMISRGISKLVLKNSEDHVPKLCSESNQHIPGISSKIAMEFSAESGRRLVAVEQIEDGSVIIIERPYASILLEHTKMTYCHHCNETLPLDFVPCSSCVDVRFCSEECLEKERSGHSLECGQVNRLYQAGLAYLAYKIFCVTSTKDMADQFFCEHHGVKRNQSDGSYGLKTGEIYDGGYRCVWNLMAHHSEIKPEDLEIYEQTARSLGRLATSRKKWPEMAARLFDMAKSVCAECKASSESCKREMANNYVTSIFLRLIEILICNAHAISALVRDKGSGNEGDGIPIERTGECKIASAIYPTASLMNHSCRPNIFSSFIGKTVIVRATRRISPGEEVLNCYGPQFGRILTPGRQEALKQQYYFDCACCACTEPEYAEREKYFTAVACPRCPKSDLVFPPACFHSEENVRQVANAMLKDSDDRWFICIKCRHRISTGDISSKIEAVEEKLEQFMQPEDDGAALQNVDAAQKLLKLMAELSELLYVHNKELSEWRDRAAEWLLKEETRVGVGPAISLMEINLFCVEFIYGAESIELANEIIKFLDVVSRALLETPDFSVFLTQDGRSRLLQMSDKAKKTLEAHYGPDCVQISELKSIVDSIPV